MAGRMEEVGRLVDLQALDTEIARLEALTREIPVAIEERAKQLSAAKAAVETAKTRQKDALKKRHALESDLKGAQDNRFKLANNLNSIKTNREYTAALHEIDASKAKESEVETAILMQMETCEKTDREVLEAEKRLKSEEARVKEQQDTLRQELTRVEGQLAAKKGDRTGVVGDIAPDLLARYERIRGGLGLAVVPVAENVCGGCFRRLPPQMGLQVRLGEEIQYCQFCGRIMYPGESEEPRTEEGLDG